MNLISIEDPRIREISQEWINFLEENHDDLPKTATSVSIAQLFLYILFTYKPPLDELLPVMEQLVNIYVKLEDDSYKERMN